jgi:hypothetical protein
MHRAALTLLLVSCALAAPAQDSDQGATPAEAPKQDDAYAKATKDFTARSGVFKVWQKDESLLFEIPKALLGRDFLWSTVLSRTPPGGYSGSAVRNGLVRWEMRGERLVLRSVSYRVRGSGNVLQAVEASNTHPVIRAFKIEARSPQGDPLIDVGRFMKSDIAEFSVRGAFGNGNLDQERTFLDRVAVFPENVNVHVDMTFSGGQGGAGGPLGRGVAGGPSLSGSVVHGIVLLPEEPMRPRLWDSRVGYFNVRVQDFGTEEHGVKEYRLINRYRLEKKDPKAAVSEPVKPIVYYIAKEVPEQWRKACKQGVEDWNVAFEAAGFKNAIVAKDAPDDADWSPEDVRFSVIRWAPLPIANAMGPHVNDPRSGEIVSAHIIMWHDILRLQAQWYFSQASAQDPRAQRLPMPDELMSELVRFVVAHEVGHTLGLPHNGKASAMVPVERLRDPVWTRQNGTCTSIMDYARFNYVAQPGDGATLIPMVGKYDKFSIMWGYAPIDAADPWAELPTLDAWAARQVDDPELRFYDNFSASDPTAQAEALGDDAVAASDYGVANLKRSMGFLMPATVKLGEDYSETAQFHGALAGQFGDYLGHVLAVVGGVVQTDYRGGRGKEVYEPVPRSYQERAVRWVCDNVLATPKWLVPPDLMWRLGQDGGLGTVSGLQRRAIGGLLNGARIGRMMAAAEKPGYSGYPVHEMLATVRSSVFASLGRPGAQLDAFDMALHRAYVETLGQRLTATDASRAVARAELGAVAALLDATLPGVGDVPARTHYADLAAWAHWALANPEKAAPAAVSVAVPFGADDETPIPGCSCGGVVRD